MSLRLLEPGWNTLVVDGGRPHHRSLGVPLGGAADRAALAIGNALVGNPPGAAALEISLAGPTVQADAMMACVVYGAPFDLQSATRDLEAGKTFTLHADEILQVGGTREGMRAYLCVPGGFQVPEILGSHSGLEPLRLGSRLPCTTSTMPSRYVRVDLNEDDCRVERDGPRACSCSIFPGPNSVGSMGARRLRVLEGPQASWFPDRGLEAYSPARVSNASNRMGLRLQGTPLTVPGRELVSEPVCPGAIQVTRDGQCIILGMDGQTIGGYPKIAQVIRADLDLLGQLRPGDVIDFERVSLETAELAARLRQKKLDEWLTRLQTCSPVG